MKYNKSRFVNSFNEAFDVLYEAIKIEGRITRISIHPYVAMFGGCEYFFKNYGKIDAGRGDKLKKLAENAETHFRYDSSLLIKLSNLRPFIPK
jgi:hypothetical protein